MGFISSVTQAFCGDCNRLRLSTEGKLYSCLFANRGHDLRQALRSADAWTDAQLADSLAQLWSAREDRYSQLRSMAGAQGNLGTAGGRRIEMSYIGG